VCRPWEAPKVRDGIDQSGWPIEKRVQTTPSDENATIRRATCRRLDAARGCGALKRGASGFRGQVPLALGMQGHRPIAVAVCYRLRTCDVRLVTERRE
jgi:hypothetical protein